MVRLSLLLSTLLKTVAMTGPSINGDIMIDAIRLTKGRPIEQHLRDRERTAPRQLDDLYPERPAPGFTRREDELDNV